MSAESGYNNHAGPSSIPIMNGFANSGSVAFPTPTIPSPSPKKMSMPEPEVPTRSPTAPTYAQSWSPIVMSPPVPLNAGSVVREKAPAQSPTYECPLCLEPPKSASNISCGHVFCTEWEKLLLVSHTVFANSSTNSCIRGHVINDPRCPICRIPANLSDLRPVFLWRFDDDFVMKTIWGMLVFLSPLDSTRTTPIWSA